MPRKNKSKAELFIELAQPDENGCSRWVATSEFTDKYERLKLGNGFDLDLGWKTSYSDFYKAKQKYFD